MGDRLIKIQGFLVIPILGALAGFAIVSSGFTASQKVGLLLLAGIGVGLPNIFVTLKWGQYLLRKKQPNLQFERTR